MTLALCCSLFLVLPPFAAPQRDVEVRVTRVERIGRGH
jgi:hypothetical protein